MSLPIIGVGVGTSRGKVRLQDMTQISTSRLDLVEQLALLGRMYNELHEQDFLHINEQMLLDGLIAWSREILDALESDRVLLVTGEDE